MSHFLYWPSFSSIFLEAEKKRETTITLTYLRWQNVIHQNISTSYVKKIAIDSYIVLCLLKQQIYLTENVYKYKRKCNMLKMHLINDHILLWKNKPPNISTIYIQTNIYTQTISCMQGPKPLSFRVKYTFHDTRK